MANWCSIAMTINAASSDAAKKLVEELKRQAQLAEEEDRMVFIGSKTRYVDSLIIDDPEDGSNYIGMNGDVRWCIDPDEMRDIVAWLKTIADIESIECEQEEGGCGVFGRYNYKDGKLTYTYIPFVYYPEYDETHKSWYDDLLDALRDHGVTEELD